MLRRNFLKILGFGAIGLASPGKFLPNLQDGVKHNLQGDHKWTGNFKKALWPGVNKFYWEAYKD